MIAVEQLSQGNAQHLATLVEYGLDHTAEELFIASQVGDAVAGHADDSTLHLWRRIEPARRAQKEPSVFSASSIHLLI